MRCFFFFLRKTSISFGATSCSWWCHCGAPFPPLVDAGLHNVLMFWKFFYPPLLIDSFPHWEPRHAFYLFGFSSRMKRRRCKETRRETADLSLQLIQITSLMPAVWSFRAWGWKWLVPSEHRHMTHDKRVCILMQPRYSFSFLKHFIPFAFHVTFAGCYFTFKGGRNIGQDLFWHHKPIQL